MKNTSSPGSWPNPTADHAAICAVIDSWGFARDGGEWDVLTDTFHPDGKISVSWFSGLFADFVDASRNRYGRSSFSKHVMNSRRIETLGDKALAETNVLLLTRSVIDGVELHGQTFMRFLDRFERRDDRLWRIARRNAIYDHDTFTYPFPADALTMPRAELEDLPSSYRFLGWRLRKLGLTVPADLPTPGCPRELCIRAENRTWLAA